MAEFQITVPSHALHEGLPFDIGRLTAPRMFPFAEQFA